MKRTGKPKPATPVFPQTVIAIIWDFDKTLSPHYMQTPLFRYFDVDEQQFWAEVDALQEAYRREGVHRVSRDILYLNHLITYAEHGLMPGLNRKLLRKLGAKIEFFPGIPEIFHRTRSMVLRHPEYRRFDIRVEHYIISTGLRDMIVGSRVGDQVDGIWACEFVESPPPPGFLHRRALFDEHRLNPHPQVRQLAYVIDNTSKTRALFEINKGTNVHPEIDVNAYIPHEDRRVPFEHMIYIADGPSDIPMFSILNQNGGHTYAVYPPGDEQAFRQVKALLEQGRVRAMGPADYREGSPTDLWITTTIRDIAEAIVEKRRAALRERVGRPPRHLSPPSNGSSRGKEKPAPPDIFTEEAGNNGDG